MMNRRKMLKKWNGPKNGWSIYPLLPMRGSSMSKRPRHKEIRCPLLTSRVRLKAGWDTEYLARILKG